MQAWDSLTCQSKSYNAQVTIKASGHIFLYYSCLFQNWNFVHTLYRNASNTWSRPILYDWWDYLSEFITEVDRDGDIGCCGYCLMFLSFILVVIFFPFSLCIAIKVGILITLITKVSCILLFTHSYIISIKTTLRGIYLFFAVFNQKKRHCWLLILMLRCKGYDIDNKGEKNLWVFEKLFCCLMEMFFLFFSTMCV